MDISIIATYGFLLLGVLAVWFPVKLFNKLPLWLVFITISFFLAIIFERASLLSLAYACILGFSTYHYYKEKKALLFFIVLRLAIPLLLHFSFLEFNNYKFLDKVSLSNDALTYSLYFNLDKTLVGIFIIAFGFRDKRIRAFPIVKVMGINYLLMVSVFFALAIVLGFIRFDPKWPSFTPVWILVNLCFTSMAEEAFFRKFIQQKIYDSVRSKYAGSISIILASVVFGLAHFKGGIVYVILVSLAGVFYGYVYYKTQRIESSIVLHFMFNLTHLLLFTYPGLK